MDCTLKFMKEYDLRSMNNRATITQDRGFGFVFVFSRAGGRSEVITRTRCVAAACSALLAGCCGHAELMILKG